MCGVPLPVSRYLLAILFSLVASKGWAILRGTCTLARVLLHVIDFAAALGLKDAKMAKEHTSRERPQENQPPKFAAEHLAALLESTQDLIWSVDLNYRLVTFNKALSDAFVRGYGAKIAVGMTPRDRLPREGGSFSSPL